MFYLTRISLTQFRNYFFNGFSFKEKIVAVCGPNGSGKTNLLDAIHYLCFTKSYFSRPDGSSVQQGSSGFRIEATAVKNEEESSLICILRETGRKEFYINNEGYKKFSLHIGKFPCVMIAPDDVALITGTSGERRSFIDTILAQLNPSYLEELISYTKVLQQRNSFLKGVAEKNRFDEPLLDVMDEQLMGHGKKIFEWRKEFLENFIPLVKEQYTSIAGKDDLPDIVYHSQLLNSGFENLLRQNRQRDLYLQRTGCGIHRDDLEIQMQQQAFKSIASQGQRKSLLFALKLAEFITIKNRKGFTPVLLLDDVFEKLDEERMNNLLRKVCIGEDAQVFITDTHKERLQNAFKNMDVPYQLIEL